MLLFLTPAIQAQFAMAEPVFTRSISGQFIILPVNEVSRLSLSRSAATNTDLVRLEPALLAVSAERIKSAFGRELGLPANAPWRGQIFLALHPAQSFDEEVTIITSPGLHGWNYRVELPDVLKRTRFMRALTGVLLREYANRDGGPDAAVADVPAWLTEGLAQDIMASDVAPVIVSSPTKVVDGLNITRTTDHEKGLDPLADARQQLRRHPALTFAQMNWPTPEQLAGLDGGIFRASAQMFVAELLALRNGPAELRNFLQQLPRFYNWQTAFQDAFGKDFPRALDVEKWWALQLVDLAAHDSGPRWTPAESRVRLDEILRVPVESRAASNALPVHAEISLQAFIRNFDSVRQTAQLRACLHALELAQFRMAQPLAALTAGYCRAIQDYLGESSGTARTVVLGKRDAANYRKISRRETLSRLDTLDAQRRQIEATLKPEDLKL